MNGTNIIEVKFDKEILIPKKPENPIPRNGVWAFIYDGEIVDKIADQYGRKNCCFKIFRMPLEGNPKRYFWGIHDRKNGLVWDATRVQNIFSIYDIAPRVYALFIFEQNGKKYLAQLTDDLGEHKIMQEGLKAKDMVNEIFSRIIEVCRKHRIIFFKDGRGKNIVKDKWVDFQGFSFEKDYQQNLIKRIDKIANWHPPKNYQTISAVNLQGRRNTEERIIKLGLDEIDFKGKTVLDIGCSAGVFCHYAYDKGAKKVVGLDLPERAKIASELAYYLGYFNNDYYGVNLKKETYESLSKKIGIDKFDIVLFLSMSYHVGYPDYIYKFCKELLVYEGNARDNDKECMIKIAEDFDKIIKKGHTTDLSKRPILWAMKKK